MKLAPVRKFIYSLPVMSELMSAANRRYINFLAAIDDPSAGIKDLDEISRPVNDGNRTFIGFNLFHGDDLDLFLAIARGEFTISGCRNKNLRQLFKRNGPQISIMLKRLKTHGLIKKIGRTYKYYLTALGLGRHHNSETERDVQHPLSSDISRDETQIYDHFDNNLVDKGLNGSGIALFILAFLLPGSLSAKLGMRGTPYFFKDYLSTSPPDDTKRAKLEILTFSIMDRRYGK